MNLSNTYYNDLRKMDTPMEKQYDKYYKLHKLKHSIKSTSRRTFAQRIQQYWRSVWQAIQTPKVPWTMLSYWKEYKGEKVWYNCMTDRIKKGIKMSIAIKVKTKKYIERHHTPHPKSKLATYQTRINRGFPHDEAIKSTLLRPAITS